MVDSPLPLDGETVVRTDAANTPSLSRFAPGTVIADRYRIVAQLGRGGMGEVYRAEDMKLGHAVALKFLPHQLAHDRGRLERLIAEVRIGRQVSHPNVCRLYDIVKWKGTHFIAMEYVDGEDLASLLRRIGRLPVDKALDIARDLVWRFTIDYTLLASAAAASRARLIFARMAAPSAFQTYRFGERSRSDRYSSMA